MSAGRHPVQPNDAAMAEPREPNSDPLAEYQRRRRFDRTPEPAGIDQPSPGARFVVQKHQARRLHYDFRLEWGGVLVSWAAPKGPSLDPQEKRLAVRTEDHPVAYGDFEGVIPAGEYGAGPVLVWDRGTWSSDQDFGAQLREGKIKFSLRGEKLGGAWMLLRLPAKKPAEEGWLLVKERDDRAVPLREGDILVKRPESVLSGRTLEAVAADPHRIWQTGGAVAIEPEKWGQPLSKRMLGRLPRAKKAPVIPETSVQLALAADSVPEGEDWFHEIKLDGYRLLATIEPGGVRLMTRNGQNWTDVFPALAADLRRLPLERALLDGEIVALTPTGATSFELLQERIGAKRTDSLVFYVFDLLYLDGYDLRDTPLERRKQTLGRLLTDLPTQRIQFCDHIVGAGGAFFAQCDALDLEGVVSKRRNARYLPGRHDSWLKVKCRRDGEFVVGGYTDPKGGRVGFGSLLVGQFNGAGRLIYSGRVGSGFTDRQLTDLAPRLAGIGRRKMPFVDVPPKHRGRDVHWVEPELVVSVEFQDRTSDGIIRHPSLRGLRSDLRPRDVRIGADREVDSDELSKPPPTAPGRGRRSLQPLADEHAAALEKVRLTNPRRVLYAELGITKLQLAEHYVAIADWILPHIVERPLTIVRCPDGAAGDCFYQRHAGMGTPPQLEQITLPDKEDQRPFLFIRDLSGLLALVQIGALELHPWGARIDRPERPDRMFFDLDPGPDVPWRETIRTAGDLRERLEDLGLVSFVKTSGGKGLHLVVPLERRHRWNEVRLFSQRVAEQAAADRPRQLTAKMTKRERQGRIYIDIQRNHNGAAIVAPYSTRARGGAPVSTPLAWEELPDVPTGDAFRFDNIRERLMELAADPWAGLLDSRQRITAAAKKRLGL